MSQIHMREVVAMLCDKCKTEVPAEYIVSHGGRNLCDDCAMDALSPAKACDPWAVKMATGSLTSTADNIKALQGTEKAIYDLITERGMVLRDELPGLLGVNENETKRAFSVLRHMELMRAEPGEGGKVRLVPYGDAQKYHG